MADMIASAIVTNAEDGPGSARLQTIRRSPSPDVSGGVKHVASDRHASYLHLPAYRKAAAAMRAQMGWGTFDPAGSSPPSSAA
jgi:hypothetical protein